MKKIMISIICIMLMMSLSNIQLRANETKDNLNSDEDTDNLLGETGGYLASNYLDTKKLNQQRQFVSPTGKGFAAEQANNFSDKLRLKKAKIVGGDNLKDGPDRLILNRDGKATFIQDKYYNKAGRTVSAAFDKETGMYRYLNADNTPMQLEVPKDQAKKAIEAMEEKITDGKVNGVTDPKEAKNIIRQGKYTFKQAENIARAGNFDSLKFDAANGMVVSLCAMGISFTLDFASCIINGENWQDAMKNSSINALKVGTGVEIVYVLSSQLGKANAPTIFKPAADKIAGLLGKNTRNALVDAFGTSGQVASKKAVSGILQSNMIVVGVTLVVFTAPDVVQVFTGRISSKQMLMNLTILIGGTAGATLGTIAGASIGGPLGAALGGIAGGTVGSLGSSTLLSTFLQSDAEDMYDVVKEEFSNVSRDFLVSNSEAKNITDSLSKKLTTNKLKDMYESDNRKDFATKLIKAEFENQIKKRTKIATPTQEEVRQTTLENMNGMIFIH